MNVWGDPFSHAHFQSGHNDIEDKIQNVIQYVKPFLKSHYDFSLFFILTFNLFPIKLNYKQKRSLS